MLTASDVSVNDDEKTEAEKLGETIEWERSDKVEREMLKEERKAKARAQSWGAGEVGRQLVPANISEKGQQERAKQDEAGASPRSCQIQNALQEGATG
jgi:hypothetical protein